jgi:hypothetical protein
MKIKEFVEKYENIATASLKEDFVRDNVKINDYLPYIDKIAQAERLVKTTSLDKDGNIRYNSPSKNLFFSRILIEQYTDLEIETNAFADEYDLLQKSGAKEMIIKLLPECEFKELNDVIDMVQDDFNRNNYEPHAYISSQVERLGTLLGATLTPILEQIASNLENMDEKTIEKLGKQAAKVLKRIK